jgi:hypothetical protein
VSPTVGLSRKVASHKAILTMLSAVAWEGWEAYLERRLGFFIGGEGGSEKEPEEEADAGARSRFLGTRGGGVTWRRELRMGTTSKGAGAGRVRGDTRRVERGASRRRLACSSAR